MADLHCGVSLPAGPTAALSSPAVVRGRPSSPGKREEDSGPSGVCAALCELCTPPLCVVFAVQPPEALMTGFQESAHAPSQASEVLLDTREQDENRSLPSGTEVAGRHFLISVNVDSSYVTQLLPPHKLTVIQNISHAAIC